MGRESPTRVHAFLPYVPVDRRQAAFEGKTLPERCEGAALFADLSGFTALTERLANAFGPHRGAEELTRHLTTVYDGLVDVTHRYRGSVIGFSGDAVTCWFGDEARAVSAAFGMQEAMASLPAAAGDVETALGLKVAVVTGSASRFVVGDPAIQRIDVLAGTTLERLAACERLADMGEVVTDAARLPAGVRPLGERADPVSGFRVAVLAAPERLAATDPWPPPPPTEPDWARSWMLPAVQDRLEHGLDPLAADFRPAAALFLSFGGIDYEGDAAAGAKLDAFVCWVQRVVAAHGGAVVQLTVGDKGSYLYAAFGAPVAREDDAARAVAAAETLRRPPQAFVRDVKIGVTHGWMYAGAYGATARRTFGVLGRKTNLAARLMSRAEPGTVLCDGDVVRRAARWWSFTELAPVRVKGVDEAVAVFAPRARVAHGAGSSRPLFGRDLELARLQDALERLLGGDPGTLLIEGAPGIGKSRLLEHLREVADARDARVLLGGGRSFEDYTPYQAWQPVVRQLLGLDDEGDAAGNVAERVAALAPNLARWSPLLNDVGALDAELPENDVTRGLATELRRSNLTHLLTELLRRRAERGPLLVVLDDAHHVDSVSGELLLAVARAVRERPAPLLLVSAYRPRELSPASRAPLAELRDAAGAIVLPVGDLEPAALDRIVADRLGAPGAEVPPALADVVRTRAAGNPFYAEELAQSLLDEGALRVEAGEIRTDRLERRASLLPISMQGLILARLDRTPSEQRATLKLASVIGAEFPLEPLTILHPTAGASSSAVRKRLTALVSHQLLAPQRTDVYAFAHTTLHEVVYGSLLYAQRARVHRQLAEWYERRAPLPPHRLHARLAHHYVHAAQAGADDSAADRAVHFLSLTADRNERLGAFAEAVAAYRVGLDLLSADGDGERRADLHVRLGSVHEKMGEYEAAAAAFEDALRSAEAPITEAAAWAGRCLVATRTGAFEEARAAGRRALEIAETSADTSLTALVRGRLGIVAALEGDLAEAEAQFAATQRHYRELDDRGNAAAWLNNLGLALVLQERFAAARERLLEALELARGEDARETEAQVLMNLGLAAHRLGELEHAAERYHDSLRLCRELLMRQDALTNVINLGDIALARGESGDAWRAYLEAGAEAIDLGAVPKALEALRGVAEASLLRRRPDRAAELLAVVLHHPASTVEVEREAQRVLERVRPLLDPDRLERALARGAPEPLRAVFAALRAEEA